MTVFFLSIIEFLVSAIFFLTTGSILIITLLMIVIGGLVYALFVAKTKKKDIENKLTTSSLDKKSLKDMLAKQESDLKKCESIITSQKEEFSSQNSKLEEIGKKIDTEVLKRTSELHTMLEKTEESNRLKDAFLEKISREIRTPLNAILGFINLLNNPDLSDQDRNYYSKYIHDSGNNLLGLIDNIIDFSKLETNELLIEPKKCNLQILIADLVEKYRNRIIRQSHDVTIIFNRNTKNIESLVDCKRVIHILDQIFSNAAKFTLEGKIEISYEIKDNSHFFQIADTGIGIPKKYQEIIFERFYQIESDSREVFHGAGLGLTIAKGLIDLLGGKIWVDSKPGDGSTFYFTIPFLGIDNLSLKDEVHEDSYDWKDKQILIAEDEDSNYHFLEAILKRTNAKLIRAVDGVKFLEIMNEKKDIDLVLLDIKMPGINGFNAIKVVRQQNITIPVIAQTAFNQPEDKQRCLDSGCNDYLAKPIDKELLLSKIARFFST